MLNFNPSNPEEGIYPDIPEAVYRNAPGINQSSLKELITPAHYHAYVTGPKKPPTPDQIIGTLTHALVLQKRELFAVIPKSAPKMPTKAQLNAKKPSPESQDAIAWWNHFRQSNPGKEFLDQEEAAQIRAMAASVWNHPTASEILSAASTFEVAAFKRHHTGLMLKGLADCIATDANNYLTVPDLKTVQAGGASELEFIKQIYNWSYHRQASFYLDLFGATYFIFIVVEKEAPFAVNCFNLEQKDIRLGREQNERDLKLIAECEKTGEWPGYTTGLKTIGIPEWALNREMNRL